MLSLIRTFLIILSSIVLSACSDQNLEPERTSDGLISVVLQTDWFAQPEHGGFYQALAKGYYKQVGLDVTILQGGPNANSIQKIIRGRAQFAMNRIDTILTLNSNKLPLVFVCTTLQSDPQALMVHEASAYYQFKDLNGKRIMATPGQTWIPFIERAYDITFEIIPHDYGLERFLADPDFIQQCLLTSEPYYVQKAGAHTRIIPLSSTGFDPYHGIYVHAEFLKKNPETVQKFIAASIHGWQDFILNDPSPAFKLIASRNRQMDQDFMTFCRNELIQRNLVTGPDQSGKSIGKIDPDRINIIVDQLKKLKLLDHGYHANNAYSVDYLPAP